MHQHPHGWCHVLLGVGVVRLVLCAIYMCATPAASAHDCTSTHMWPMQLYHTVILWLEGFCAEMQLLIEMSCMNIEFQTLFNYTLRVSTQKECEKLWFYQPQAKCSLSAFIFYYVLINVLLKCIQISPGSIIWLDKSLITKYQDIRVLFFPLEIASIISVLKSDERKSQKKSKI